MSRHGSTWIWSLRRASRAWRHCWAHMYRLSGRSWCSAALTEALLAPLSMDAAAASSAVGGVTGAWDEGTGGRSTAVIAEIHDGELAVHVIRFFVRLRTVVVSPGGCRIAVLLPPGATVEARLDAGVADAGKLVVVAQLTTLHAALGRPGSGAAGVHCRKGALPARRADADRHYRTFVGQRFVVLQSRREVVPAARRGCSGRRVRGMGEGGRARRFTQALRLWARRARCFSRAQSRSLAASRLSWACLPLASAISSLMRFLLQYIAVGTSV